MLRRGAKDASMTWTQRCDPRRISTTTSQSSMSVGSCGERARLSRINRMNPSAEPAIAIRPSDAPLPREREIMSNRPAPAMATAPASAALA